MVLKALPHGKPYLRLVQSVRVTNQSGHKVPQKQVVANIGPLDRFDDGQPDYVARLKKSFKAGSPLIPSLEPYCASAKTAETYHLSINEGSPECFHVGHKCRYIFSKSHKPHKHWKICIVTVKMEPLWLHFGLYKWQTRVLTQLFCFCKYFFC